MRPLQKLLIFVLIAALAGCERNKSPRDFSNALIGHWESLDGKEHHYIASGEMTSYFAENDRLSTYKYIVLQQYPKSRTIEIRVQSQGNSDFKDINDRKIVFSDDYKMAEVHLRLDMSELLKEDDPDKLKYTLWHSWRYVDGKQRP